jgi:endonuclease/exonuclease/phosphatase family metal-dependent hydrolase
MKALLQHIVVGNYDVVCLQEFQERTCMFGVSDGEHQEAYQEFRENMKAMGFHDQMCGPPVSGDATFDGGTCLFSRYPFTTSKMIQWEESMSWDACAAKGIVYARIEIPPENGCTGAAMPVNIITMHAQALHVGWMDFDGKQAYREVRLRQMRQVADFISSEANGEAVLALGDFNFDARNAKDLALHQQVLRDCKHPSAPIDVISQTYGKHPSTFADVDENDEPIERFLTLEENKGSPKCLDHVYFWPAAISQTSQATWGAVKGLECMVDPMKIPDSFKSLEALESTHISDHYGVCVDIGIIDVSSCPTTPVSSPVQPQALLLQDLEGKVEKRLNEWLSSVPIGGVAPRSFDSSPLVQFACKHNLWDEAPDDIYAQFVEHKIRKGERALVRKSRQHQKQRFVNEVEAGLLMLAAGDW